MFICLSPGGQSTTAGESPKDRLLVGTVEGIFSFAKRGGAWNQQDNLIPGKHISSIIFEPTSQTLFAGTYTGEIYASTDLGKTWERRDNGIGDNEIYSLATPDRATHLFDWTRERPNAILPRWSFVGKRFRNKPSRTLTRR